MQAVVVREVRAVVVLEVRAVEVLAGVEVRYRKTRVTIESCVVCFGANTFHWLNVCLFKVFCTEATNKRFCSSLVKSVKSVATD